VLKEPCSLPCSAVVVQSIGVGFAVELLAFPLPWSTLDTACCGFSGFRHRTGVPQIVGRCCRSPRDRPRDGVQLKDLEVVIERPSIPTVVEITPRRCCAVPSGPALLTMPFDRASPQQPVALSSRCLPRRTPRRAVHRAGAASAVADT